MKYLKLGINIIIMSYLVSCSASYDRLTKLEKNSPNSFQEYLLDEYKIKAIYEAEEMHDWNSAKFYSEKALRSIDSEDIYPEKTSYWKLPKESISELETAYESLLLIYEDAKLVDPYNLAKSIVSLDCWFEQQEEVWQTWDIEKCKSDFLNSMHKIYNRIVENNKDNKINLKLNKKDKATVVTKNKNDEILQIIYFDFDKSELSKTSIETIKTFINKNRNEINEYLIIGHTDTKGTKEYNKNLSIERAKFVKNLLLEYEIENSKVKIFGSGEESLAIDTADEIKHPANRRVEIKKSN